MVKAAAAPSKVQVSPTTLNYFGKYMCKEVPETKALVLLTTNVYVDVAPTVGSDKLKVASIILVGLKERVVFEEYSSKLEGSR